MIADRLRTISLSNDIHPTGVAIPVDRIHIIPLTTAVV